MTHITNEQNKERLLQMLKDFCVKQQWGNVSKCQIVIYDQKSSGQKVYILLIFSKYFSQSLFIKISDIQTSLLVNTQCFLFFSLKKKKQQQNKHSNNVVGSFYQGKNPTESDKNPSYLQEFFFFSPF